MLQAVRKGTDGVAVTEYFVSPTKSAVLGSSVSLLSQGSITLSGQSFCKEITVTFGH